MPESKKTQWSDADKAAWILAHGKIKIHYMYYFVQSTGVYYKVNEFSDYPWNPIWPEPVPAEYVWDRTYFYQNVETEHELFSRYQS